MEIKTRTLITDDLFPSPVFLQKLYTSLLLQWCGYQTPQTIEI